MQKITDTNKRGLADVYAGTTPYNAQERQIQQALSRINTAFLGRVDSCASHGENGSKTVCATSLTAQTDGNGAALPSPSYQNLAHYRVQGGKAALIIDPVPGDIGIFVCQKKDGSNVKAGTSQPQAPASYRMHSPADAVMVGTVHTQPPEVYIEIKQDLTVIVHAPAGVTIETDSAVTIKAPTVTMSGNLEVAGRIVAKGNITGAGISLNSHTHKSVQPGSGSSGGPQ